MSGPRRLYFTASPDLEALLSESGVSPAAVVQAVYAAYPELFEWAALRLASDGVFRAHRKIIAGLDKSANLCSPVVSSCRNVSTTATNSQIWDF